MIEKEDISLADFKGMNYKIRLNAKTIPNEDLLKNTAQIIWQNGNKHWEEFYVSVYLTDMSTKEEAYCVLDYTSNGFEGVTYNTVREVGSGIKAYVPAWKNEDKSIGAWLKAKDIVKRSLKSPSTADFPYSIFYEDYVSRIDQVYTIRSYVDSQNGFGATIRSNFMVKIKQVSKDNWSLLEVNFY